MNNFNCKQCGKCCKDKFVKWATLEDIERWEKHGRNDILQYLKRDIDPEIYLEHGRVELFFNPNTGIELDECPFLKKENNHYTCVIHNTKPTCCKEYYCKNEVEYSPY